MKEYNLLKVIKFDKDKWVVPYTNLITIFMILFMVLFVFAFTGSRLQYEKMLLTIENSLGKEQKTDLELLELSEKLAAYVSSRGLQELVKLQILPDICAINRGSGGGARGRR